jgi:effector-binding domain-containing protein
MTAATKAPELAARIREEGAQDYVGKKLRVPVTKLAPKVGEALSEIYGHLATMGIKAVSPPFGTYHAPHDGNIECEVGVPCERPCAAAGDLEPGRLPGGAVAFAVHTGAYSEIPALYPKLWEWIKAHGHTSKASPREVYLTDPTDARTTFPTTELVWPII